MKKSDPYRVFGWLIPILCMVAAAFVVHLQHDAFIVAQTQRDAAEKEVAAANEDKAKADKLMSEQQYAAAEDTPNEQTIFLTDLRKRAADSGAVIDHWSSQATQYGSSTTPGAAGGANPADAADADLVKGITRVSNTLALTGSYAALRKFIEGITTSKRLLTLSNINWTRTTDGTSLNVTLTRYVAPAQNSSSIQKSDSASPATVAGTNP